MQKKVRKYAKKRKRPGAGYGLKQDAIRIFRGGRGAAEMTLVARTEDVRIEFEGDRVIMNADITKSGLGERRSKIVIELDRGAIAKLLSIALQHD